MLHARIEVAQVLDSYAVRCVITEFHAGADPEVFTSDSGPIVMTEDELSQDALSIIHSALRLWSESTNL